MAHFELRLLGPPTLLRDGAPVDLERRCALALLAYLAVETDGAHTCLRRDDLAALFWPDADAEHARSSLRRTLAALTKAFAGTGLTADRESICLSRSSTGAVRADVDHFRSLLAHCRHYGRPADSVCEQCLLPLIEAAALYRGDFMAGFTLPGSIGFDDWQRVQSDNLRCELAGVLNKLVTGLAERRSYQQAIGYAQRWVALDPLHEPAQRSLMQLYAVAGQPQMALRQYDECAALLDRDLGAAPQPETQALCEAIRADRALVASRTGLTLSESAPTPLQIASSTLLHTQTELPAHPRLDRLVGREDAFTAALEGWRRVRAGEVRMLFLSGEPGIGKTHFARTVAQEVSATGGVTLGGECSAFDTTPYAPVAQCIRGQLAARVNAEQIFRLPGSVLSDLLLLAPDLHAHLPNLARNPPLGPQAEQLRLCGSVYAICGALAQEGMWPLLLLLDDVQWVDSGTLHLMRYLIQRAALSRRRFWLIMTHSDRWIDPTESAVLHDLLLEGRRMNLLDEIALNRFDREQTRELLTCDTGGKQLPHLLLDAVYTQSEGVPFIIREIGKSLVGEEAAHVSCPLPPAVRAAVLGRVAHLPPLVQEALRHAAVIGPRFEFDQLQHASAIDEGALIAALECASRKLFVQEERGDEEGGTGSLVYGFSHALIPLILRESMSGPRRRQYEGERRRSLRE